MLLLALPLLLNIPVGGQVSVEVTVAELLDRFHQAASRADGAAYFECFTEEAQFIGTDAGETWSLSEFKAFCTPYFSQGKGWTYLPTEREVHYGPNGNIAWFVEMLDNKAYGQCRGTGVCILEDGRWKIAQYHLTIPIPNGIAKDVVAMIREHRP